MEKLDRNYSALWDMVGAIREIQSFTNLKVGKESAQTRERFSEFLDNDL